MRVLGVLLMLCATAALGEGRRYVTDAEAAAWSGVGLIYSPAGSCTAVLIRPDVVLTAAHCVADADAKTTIPADRLTFSAGLKDGRRLQNMRARRVDVHPGYFVAASRYDKRRVRVDVARVVLEGPIRRAPSYAVASTPPLGADVAMLSYPGTKRKRVSIQAPCRIVERDTEFLLLDCETEPGSSGAPYFSVGRDGVARVVGIHSGSRERGGRTYALALAFAHLRDFIGRSEATTPASFAATPDVTVEPSQPAKPPRTTRLPGGSVPGSRLPQVSQ